MQNLSIEDADTPEAFIRALRRQAEKCHEAASELQSAWQDKTAGKFWTIAARKLEMMAYSLERIAP